MCYIGYVTGTRPWLGEHTDFRTTSSSGGIRFLIVNKRWLLHLLKGFCSFKFETGSLLLFTAVSPCPSTRSHVEGEASSSPLLHDRTWLSGWDKKKIEKNVSSVEIVFYLILQDAIIRKLILLSPNAKQSTQPEPLLWLDRTFLSSKKKPMTLARNGRELKLPWPLLELTQFFLLFGLSYWATSVYW